MQTQLVLRSSAFPAYDGEADQINPGRFGRRLAETLAARLASRGYTTSEPMAEDWGWRVEVDNKALPLWLGCGNVDGEVDEFLVFLEPSKPVVRRGFRKVSTVEAVTALAQAVDEVLREHPDVTDVEWS